MPDRPDTGTTCSVERAALDMVGRPYQCSHSPGTTCRDTDLRCEARGGFKHFTGLALLMTMDFGKLVSDIRPPRGHSETKYLSRFVAFRR